MVQGALIAAIYAVLTVAFAPISYGPLQVRISEALTVLPFFTPAAIPGLFIGCIIANLYGMLMGMGAGMLDVVFGSLATLLAAYLSYKMPKKWLVPLPPVVVNGVVVGLMLYYVLQLPLLATMGWVALGELVACYVIGYPLILVLNIYKDKIFR
ncbi:MAG TPA: QueT transporter family protein [Clostridia bacterium]|nr:QueT transporter family protein [Clostridia bacterium]